MANAVQSLTYLGQSTLGADGLRLQTSGGVAERDPGAEHPRFFTGFLTTPEAAAVGLLATAEVARTRYFQPVSPASLDPVVTSSRDRLRFESFSGCCGVYARMDVLPAGLDGDVVDHGTTNVDVNTPLRQALARVGAGEPLHLSVGADDLTVSTMDDSLVEKRVPLPSRWLRGFAEVQAIVSGFDPRATLGPAEATAFLRRLSGSGGRAVLWAVPAGPSLRLTSRPAPGAVCLPGPERLATLLPLLRFAKTLTVYGPPVRSDSPPVASTWELSTDALRLSLTLSPAPSRGFSGEGAVLADLASDYAADDADLVSALLAWDPTVDVDLLSAQSSMSAERVLAALTQLGTAGQVGFDVAEAAYFHRILPYDASYVDKHNPRLVRARLLARAGAVTSDAEGATVRGGDEVYRVRRVGDELRCTCQWWTRYRGTRGPCAHALAATLAGAALIGAAR